MLLLLNTIICRGCRRFRDSNRSLPLYLGTYEVQSFQHLFFSIFYIPRFSSLVVIFSHRSYIRTLVRNRSVTIYVVCQSGVLTGATKAQNAKIAGKFDGHLRLSEGLNVTSSGEAKGVSKHEM